MLQHKLSLFAAEPEMPEIQNLDVWHISNKGSCLRTNFRVFSFNNSFLFTHKTSHALNFSHRQPMRDLEFPSSSEFIEILSFEIACFNAHALILVYFQLLAQLLNLIFHNFYEKEGWEVRVLPWLRSHWHFLSCHRGFCVILSILRTSSPTPPPYVKKYIFSWWFISVPFWEGGLGGIRNDAG